MGTWGAGPFDNDEAGDWAYDFEGADAATGLELLGTALDLGGSSEYLEYDDGVSAVAAAAVVSWLQDPAAIPDSAYAEDAAQWVRSTGITPDASLKASALAALGRVRSDESELAELWAEGDGPAAWLESLDEIAARLR